MARIRRVKIPSILDKQSASVLAKSDAASVCPKCRSQVLSTRHCDGDSELCSTYFWFSATLRQSHLHEWCLGCEYEWFRLPSDYEPASDRGNLWCDHCGKAHHDVAHYEGNWLCASCLGEFWEYEQSVAFLRGDSEDTESDGDEGSSEEGERVVDGVLSIASGREDAGEEEPWLESDLGLG